MRIPLVLLALTLPLAAREAAKPREIPVARPAEVGMSADKLEEIGPAVENLINRKKLAGASVIVLRKGKVAYRGDFGQRNRARQQAVEDDTIFRIYSMTKAVTSAAAMMLVEQDKLGLDDPLHKFIPEMKQLKVSAGGGEVAPDRQPTVRDLLRHTSGYGYGNPRLIDRGITLEEMGRRAAAVPLNFQPGTSWLYGISTDLLARVVEVASGEPFDVFLKKQLLDPLDMRDTGFHVPAAKRHRFSVVYGKADLLVPVEPVAGSKFLSEPKHLSGGGGLVSTIRDYSRFLQMIANRGEFQGRRYLKPDTVELMTTDQLPDSIGSIAFGRQVRLGVGFGLGFCVKKELTSWDPDARVGEFGWGGMASTHYWVSPRDQLVVITMEQTLPYNWNLERTLKPIIYDAIED